MDSGQSRSSRSFRSRSPYAVIFSIHCFMGLRITGWFPRSDRPSITSSFASTVPSAGHQFTGTSAWYAKPRSRSCRKIHCVHLKYVGSQVATSLSQSYENPRERSCSRNRATFFAVVSFGCVPVSIAYCSAGSPNASHPIGCSTL